MTHLHQQRPHRGAVAPRPASKAEPTRSAAGTGRDGMSSPGAGSPTRRHEPIARPAAAAGYRTVLSCHYSHTAVRLD